MSKQIKGYPHKGNLNLNISHIFTPITNSILKSFIMKKIFLRWAVGIFSILITSCSKSSFPAQAQDKNIYASSMGIYQLPQIADLDIGQQRVKLTLNYNRITLEDAKKLAKADFIKNQNCDLIVEPLLVISNYQNKGRSSRMVTISGYPASYKNIRNVELGDSIYFKNHRIQ